MYGIVLVYGKYWYNSTGIPELSYQLRIIYTYVLNTLVLNSCSKKQGITVLSKKQKSCKQCLATFPHALRQVFLILTRNHAMCRKQITGRKICHSTNGLTHVSQNSYLTTKDTELKMHHIMSGFTAHNKHRNNRTIYYR